MGLIDFYSGKVILITGAAGTVGREIVRQLIAFQPRELRLLDNNETDLFFLKEEYKDSNIFCFLGDIKDKEKVEKHAYGAEIVIHCAAFKHVTLCEYNPFSTVQTNIVGVENIIQAATACGVQHVLLTSSDKAVNPTNVMGASKLMGEKLITAANAINYRNGGIFSSTRFGNVVGSKGSVVPLFLKQIAGGGPVTLTDRRMSRFIMSVAEAASLVLKSITLARGGEVFVTKMPVVRIPDLAQVMIDLLARRYGHRPADIKVVEIGAKPGEKLFEELMSSEEITRSLELRDMFVITPAFKSIYEKIDYNYPEIVSERVPKPYISTSGKAMTRGAIKKFLIDHKVVDRI